MVHETGETQRMQVRRVVTGTNADRKAVFTSDEVMEPDVFGAIPGLEWFLLWGTERDDAVVGAEPSEAVRKPYWPAPGGTRCVLVRWAPQSAVPEPDGDPKELADEAERALPGLLGAFEEGGAMHTSDTIDYGVCLEGEMWLTLDDGAEVHLTPGSCVVQRGTRHAWENRGDKPALMLYVLVGAERAG